MFIHASHDASRPLYVSPPFNSTNTGDPTEEAAFNNVNGN